MKFTKVVAIFAISTLAINASAYSDGTLRRGRDVAQNDVEAKEVNININTNSTSGAEAQQKAVAQPVTTVEAAPIAESKAEVMRKARQDAEVGTEQKIVEKLEESRLKEERARADRLFGDKLETPAEKPAAAAAVVAAPVAAPAPVPAPVVEDKKPQQVTIEKIEIVQPAPIVEQKSEPVAESKASLKAEEPEQVSHTRYFVTPSVGNLSYQASNVKSNYGLGVAVGTIVDEKFGFELGYFYSNHTISDYQNSTLFHKLDQSDVQFSGKYYFLSGKVKPWVGASATYINRKYTDRYYYNPNQWNWNTNNYSTTENTQAVNAGLLGGVDFAVNEWFSISGGLDYNFNVMQISGLPEYGQQYPAGVQELEKINYYAIKVGAKFTF